MGKCEVTAHWAYISAVSQYWLAFDPFGSFFIRFISTKDIYATMKKGLQKELEITKMFISLNNQMKNVAKGACKSMTGLSKLNRSLRNPVTIGRHAVKFDGEMNALKCIHCNMHHNYNMHKNHNKEPKVEAYIYGFFLTEPCQ